MGGGVQGFGRGLNLGHDSTTEPMLSFPVFFLEGQETEYVQTAPQDYPGTCSSEIFMGGTLVKHSLQIAIVRKKAKAASDSLIKLFPPPHEQNLNKMVVHSSVGLNFFCPRECKKKWYLLSCKFSFAGTHIININISTSGGGFELRMVTFWPEPLTLS